MSTELVKAQGLARRHRRQEEELRLELGKMKERIKATKDKLLYQDWVKCHGMPTDAMDDPISEEHLKLQLETLQQLDEQRIKGESEVELLTLGLHQQEEENQALLEANTQLLEEVSRRFGGNLEQWAGFSYDDQAGICKKEDSFGWNVPAFLVSEAQTEGKKVVLKTETLAPAGDKRTKEVWETVLPMVSKAFDGYNVTLFTYGMTGSGKTYTMLGPTLMESAFEGTAPPTSSHIGKDDNRGVVVRVMQQIFKQVPEARVSLNYVQVYQERCYDLLQPASTKPLRVREDCQKKPGQNVNVFLEDLTEVIVTNVEDADMGTAVEAVPFWGVVRPLSSNEQRKFRSLCFRATDIMDFTAIGCRKQWDVKSNGTSKAMGCRKQYGVESNGMSKARGCGKQGDVESNGMSKAMGRRKQWDVESNGVSKAMGRRKQWDVESNGVSKAMGRRKQWDVESNGVWKAMGCRKQ
eukprot:s5267_g1.t1